MPSNKFDQTFEIEQQHFDWLGKMPRTTGLRMRPRLCVYSWTSPYRTVTKISYSQTRI